MLIIVLNIIYVKFQQISFMREVEIMNKKSEAGLIIAVF